jgi:RNA polymerase sigma-70 factor (ECF subfamily)
MAQRSMTLPQKPKPLAATHEQPGPAELEDLFHRQWSRLCAALYRFTGDPDEAEDLALEAFVQLWQRPPARTENLGGWLYRVATRLGLNRLRSTARRNRYELDAAREALRGEAPGDPEGEIARRAERARVRGVLADMDERQARLLLLRHSGFSYQEIGAALNLNPASVGTLLARAEQTFTERYQQTSPWESPPADPTATKD